MALHYAAHSVRKRKDRFDIPFTTKTVSTFLTRLIYTTYFTPGMQDRPQPPPLSLSLFHLLQHVPDGHSGLVALLLLHRVVGGSRAGVRESHAQGLSQSARMSTYIPYVVFSAFCATCIEEYRASSQQKGSLVTCETASQVTNSWPDFSEKLRNSGAVKNRHF